MLRDVMLRKIMPGHDFESRIGADSDPFKDFKCKDAGKDCNSNGVCSGDGLTCECSTGYTTHEPEDVTMCNYQQKKQITAFLLQLCFGIFGAADFYVGKTIYAGDHVQLPAKKADHCFPITTLLWYFR